MQNYITVWISSPVRRLRLALIFEVCRRKSLDVILPNGASPALRRGLLFRLVATEIVGTTD